MNLKSSDERQRTKYLTKEIGPSPICWAKEEKLIIPIHRPALRSILRSNLRPIFRSSFSEVLRALRTQRRRTTGLNSLPAPGGTL